MRDKPIVLAWMLGIHLGLLLAILMKLMLG